MENPNIEPSSVNSAKTRPPIDSAVSFTMLSPRPVPSTDTASCSCAR